MTTSIEATHATIRPARRPLRSVGAVTAAFVVMAIVTLIVDQILHVLGVFPPWGQVTYEPVPYALAVAYRTAFGVLGGYLAARWAPRAPMRHALALGVVGVVLSGFGAAVTVVRELGPAWYAIALVIVSLPAAWLGGRLFIRTR